MQNHSSLVRGHFQCRIFILVALCGLIGDNAHGTIHGDHTRAIVKGQHHVFRLDPVELHEFTLDHNVLAAVTCRTADPVLLTVRESVLV